MASFTSSCPGALSVHYFTIDGQTLNGTLDREKIRKAGAAYTAIGVPETHSATRD